MNPIHILGVSAFYHDSAACLVREGEIIAAAHEERFTRKKQDENFPIHALYYCLEEGKISIDNIDVFVFYENPALKFNRVIENILTSSDLDLEYAEAVVNLWAKNKFWQEEIIRKWTGYRGKIIFPTHHQSHAASAFFPSPYKDAAIITADGVGESNSTVIGIGNDNRIELLKTIDFPHSLGMLYSAFTYYCGFRVNSGEYKLMGLAPYGEPKYVDLIKQNMIDIKEDGSYCLNLEYFDYLNGRSMINDKFRDFFGSKERKPDERLTQLFIDVARSIQVILNEVMLKMATFTKKITEMKNLCMAGGTALNCVANYEILRNNIFENIWVQPAAGDAGGALGAALFAWHQYLGKSRHVDGIHDKQKASLLGPSYSNTEIKSFLDSVNAVYEELDESAVIEWVANNIMQEKVVGHFHGRMEFGPRALGNRSILGDARSPNLQKTMNLKIKFRESFRPFAPSVLEDKVCLCYATNRRMPYMLFSVPVADSMRVELHGEDLNKKGIDQLGSYRSRIPAVTHVDYSARIQTVSYDDNPRYYNIIHTVYKKTGIPTIINTSFNVRGEPIVCSPRDAFNCFMNTNIDCLVMGNFVLEKDKQPADVEFDHNRQFNPD